MMDSTEFPPEKMADLLNVSRSGFYKYRDAVASGAKAERAERIAVFDAAVRTSHESEKRRIGTPKIYHKLRGAGVSCSRKRIAQSLRKQGLRSTYRKKYRPCTTDSAHVLPVAPNLLDRRFEQQEANRAWVTDITYIPSRQGWLYLAVFIDLFSRMIVGWNIAEHMETSMVLTAFHRAIWKRNPQKGFLVHSDRGTQFASSAFVHALNESGAIQSMSRKGNCWDNAVAESFFGCLKSECVGNAVFENIEQASSALFEYIEVYYNRSRMHSANGFLSPAQRESKLLKRIA